MSKHDLKSILSEDVLRDIAGDSTVKTNIYPEKFNPFRSALSQIRLSEYENLRLSELLERAIVAKTTDELSKVVDEALQSGIRINAHNEDGFSFASVIVLKVHDSKFIGNKQENIIRKLTLNGANFDESFMLIQGDKETIEICNKVKKEVEPHTYNRLQKLREVGENAAINGAIENVEIDNKTFFIEFSYNCKVDVAKVVEGTKNLGLSKGDLKIGGNILKIGSDEIEIKTEENGKRNYVDISDSSSFKVTFHTSLGELNVKVHQDIKNYDQVQVEVENKELWNELQRIGETVGQNCLFGGIPIKAAIETGYFMRSGRSESTEVIKHAEPENNETISWVDRVKNDKTAPIERT